MMKYRVLLLSAYDAMSHKLWRGRLVEMFPEHEWTQLTLPPRHFNWRIRGNSLQWALNERELLENEYDLLIVTSMVDLASLRGFIPQLVQLPTLLYFHENQFDYPIGRTQRQSNIEPQLVPLYSTLCADAIVFNSEYNRSTFLSGANQLLARLPDRLSSELLQKIELSEVIPVPLEDFSARAAMSEQKEHGQILDVVWNHRWEYDKGPELLLQLAKSILDQGLAIRLHVVGQQFRSCPPEFQQLEKILQQHAIEMDIESGSFGYIQDRSVYLALLEQCDIVLSTALHDFQGLAIQEACALGCTPLVPNALVYPEYIAAEFLYQLSEDSKIDASCANIVKQLQHLLTLRSAQLELPKLSLERFSKHVLRPKYGLLLDRLMRGKKN